MKSLGGARGGPTQVVAWATSPCARSAALPRSTGFQPVPSCSTSSIWQLTLEAGGILCAARENRHARHGLKTHATNKKSSAALRAHGLVAHATCSALLKLLVLALVSCIPAGAFAAPPTPPATQPATAPADPTLDWLLNQATTAPSAPAPATVPSTQEETPFGENKNPDIRRGAITLSDGEKIPGKLATTAEQPIRLWDEQKKEYRDIPWKVIKSMQAKVLWEREEPEWHFKESGSDIKEFSGKTYPNREMQYTIELRNGQSVTGGVAAPIYLQTPKGNKLFILHKRDKGEVGQTLKDLVYVKRVDLEEDEDGKK